MKILDFLTKKYNFKSDISNILLEMTTKDYRQTQNIKIENNSHSLDSVI